MVFRAAIGRYFNDHTPIDGFSFINQSRKWWQIAFWCGLLSCLALLTVYDLYSLTMRFMDHPTSTTIEVMTNDAFSMPDMGLCIVLSLPDIVHRDGHSWELISDSVADILTDLRDRNSSLLTESWKDIPLDREFIVIVGYMLDNLRAWENAAGYVDLTSADFDWNATHLFYNDEVARVTLATLSKLVYDDLKKQNLHNNLTALSQKLGEHICAISLDISAHIYINNHDASPFGLLDCENMPSWLQQGKICFATRTFTFNTPNDWMDIDVDYKALYPSLFPEFDVIGPHGESAFESEFEGETVLQLDNEYQVLQFQHQGETRVDTKMGTQLCLTIAVSAEYKSLSVKKNCSEDLKLSQCRSRCLSDIITKACPHCIPFTWSHLIDNAKGLRHCTMDDYNTCLVYDGWGGSGTCEGRCKSSCDIKVYNLKVVKTIRYIKEEHSATFVVFPVARPYPVFIEEELLTWSSFFSELGGVASLWLGASFIGLVHLFWFLLFDLPLLLKKPEVLEEYQSPRAQRRGSRIGPEEASNNTETKL